MESTREQRRFGRNDYKLDKMFFVSQTFDWFLTWIHLFSFFQTEINDVIVIYCDFFFLIDSHWLVRLEFTDCTSQVVGTDCSYWIFILYEIVENFWKEDIKRKHSYTQCDQKCEDGLVQWCPQTSGHVVCTDQLSAYLLPRCVARVISCQCSQLQQVSGWIYSLYESLSMLLKMKLWWKRSVKENVDPEY